MATRKIKKNITKKRGGSSRSNSNNITGKKRSRSSEVVGESLSEVSYDSNSGSRADSDENDYKVYYDKDYLLELPYGHASKGATVGLNYKTDPRNPTKALINGIPMDIRFTNGESHFTVGTLTETTFNEGKKPSGAVKIRNTRTREKVYLNELQLYQLIATLSKKEQKTINGILQKRKKAKYDLMNAQY